MMKDPFKVAKKHDHAYTQPHAHKKPIGKHPVAGSI